MLNTLSDITSTVFSGWIVTWPTSLFAIIWLAFAASWILASFWSGRTKSHVRTLNAWVYRLPILLGAIFLAPPIEHLLGAVPLYRLSNAAIYLLAVVVVLGLCLTWWARI